MLGICWDTILLQFFLAVKDLLPQSLKVDFEFLRLGQHFVFFFLDVVTHALGEYLELGVAMIIFATGVAYFERVERRFADII